VTVIATCKYDGETGCETDVDDDDADIGMVHWIDSEGDQQTAYACPTCFTTNELWKTDTDLEA